MPPPPKLFQQLFGPRLTSNCKSFPGDRPRPGSSLRRDFDCGSCNTASVRQVVIIASLALTTWVKKNSDTSLRYHFLLTHVRIPNSYSFDCPIIEWFLCGTPHAYR